MRFVQMDKNSENKVRKERIEAEEKAAKKAAKLARERAQAAGEYVAPFEQWKPWVAGHVLAHATALPLYRCGTILA